MQRGLTWKYLAVAAFILCSCIFGGCKTKRTTTRTTDAYTHTRSEFDSAAYYRNMIDSLSRIQVKRDSIVIRDSVVIYKDAEGNVTNRESWHFQDNWHNLIDQLNRLTINDVQGFKLTGSRDQQTREHDEREKVVVTKAPAWIQGAFMLLIVAAFILATLKLYRYGRPHF